MYCHSTSARGALLRPAVFFSTSALALILAAIPLGSGAQAGGPVGWPSTTDIWTPTANGAGSSAAGVSGDGSIVVGSFDESGRTSPIMWTATGSVTLEKLITIESAQALAVSADGNLIVGYSIDQYGWQQSARWDTDGKIYTQANLNNGNASEARGVSADGSIVVGWSYDGPTGTKKKAVYWDTGVHVLAMPADFPQESVANGVSGDGTVIVGKVVYTNSHTAVRWDQAGNITQLSSLPGGQDYSANAISRDGSTIVGYSYQGVASPKQTAVYWDTGDSDQIHSLGFLSGGAQSEALAVNATGSIIVGTANDGNADRAFRWTQASGMTTVENWLRTNGATIANDITKKANGVSADGNVVVGELTSGDAFIARVAPASNSGGSNTGTGGSGTDEKPSSNTGSAAVASTPSTTTSGIINVQQYTSTLLNKPTTSVGLSYANTVLNGAHGEPMRNLLATGQQSIWATADIGHDESSLSEGNLGIGDFGYGYGFDGGITGRLAFGGIYTEQDISTGGKFDARAFYVAPEASIALGSSDIYATIGGYYSAGRMNINRGYLNGGAMDTSRGETDTETFAAKLRFDWLNAATVEGINFTPYASLSYAHSHMDAYTETGGSFPSRFNAVNDHSTVARLGVDMVRDVTEEIRLTARAEAAYRFEKQTAGTSGQIVGLSTFSYDGQDINQLWARGSLGTEFDIAGGTASLSLNVTSKGDDPDVWLRTGWKVKF